MAFTADWLEASFGPAKAGIATVGYRLYKNDGTDSVARTTTNVVEVGFGTYGVPSVNIPDDAFGVEWDTGGVGPVYAHEGLEALRIADSVLTDTAAMQPTIATNLDTTVSSRGTADPGDLMGLANDAITSAKFDESTAFPLTAADTGDTYVARTGADGDTLETLSDEIVSSNLTAQQVRDSMKLAPTAGAAAAGSVDAHLDTIITDTDFIKDMEGGRWRIVGTQMIFYDSAGTTEVARFNLYNGSGVLSASNVMERRRV